MKIPYILLIMLSVFNIAQAQSTNNSAIEDWRNIVLVSRVEGTNTTGVHFEYLQNRNQWWGDWLVPWVFRFQSTELRDKTFNKTNYQTASVAQLTVGVNGYKPLTDSLLLNLDGGVVIGNEKLTSFSSAYSERVFVGLSLFQGILFVPRINVPIVLKAGIYEEVLSSKLYNFDVGVKIGVGLMF
jgi:hypothetical protein